MSEPQETQASESSADKVAAPSADDVTSPQAPAEGGGDVPEGEEKPEGEKLTDPKDEPKEKLTPNVLSKWSQSLSRRKERIESRETKLADRERAIQERETKAAEVLTLLETDPDKLLDQIAKVKGVSKPVVYKSWMEKHLQENDPSEQVKLLQQRLDEREAKEAADRAAAQKQAEENAETNKVNSFRANARPYIEGVLDKYEHLEAYGAESVWDRATSIVVHHWKSTGKELPLDKVLQDMENATAAEFRRIEAAKASRLRPGDENIQPTSERAGPEATGKPEARKRSISNAHAATRATPGSEKDILDMSEKELDRLAVEAVRRADPRWR